MAQGIATVVFALGILGLFVLNRDPKAQTSKALWIPVVWVLIGGSRMVSEWLHGSSLTNSDPDSLLHGNPLDRDVLTALLVLAVIVLVGRGRQVGRLLRANGPLLLFFTYCGVSIFWSDYPDVAFKRWTKYVGDLVMVLIVLTDPKPIAAVKRLLSRAGFLLIPLSILLIKYYPSLGRGYSTWTWESDNNGVATGKNGLGYVCLVFGLGSLWCLLEAFRAFRAFRGGERARAAGPLIAHCATLAMALWLFLMADSATSFACFLVGGGLIAVTSTRVLTRKPAVVHLIVGAVLLVVVYGLLLNPGAGLVKILGRESTLTSRTEIWRVTLDMTRNPLFGTGFESFWLGPRLDEIWKIYAWHPNQAHNGYLEVFLNEGWIGVVLLAVVLVTGYWRVAAACYRDPLNKLRLAYFVVAVAYNLTEAGFKMMHPVWIAFLLATIAVPEGAVRIKTRRAVAPRIFSSQAAPCLEEA